MHLQMSAHECAPYCDSLRLTFDEFLDLRDRSEKERFYFQAPMLIWQENGQVEIAKTSSAMRKDLASLDLSQILWLSRLGDLGRLQRSTLFCSGEGALSPLHYDQAQNLYFQLQGSKRFLLFPPELGHCFYPFPVVHPMDLRA